MFQQTSYAISYQRATGEAAIGVSFSTRSQEVKNNGGHVGIRNIDIALAIHIIDASSTTIL